MLVVAALPVLSSVQAFRVEAAGWWHPTYHSDQGVAGEWLAGNTRPADRIITRSMVVGYYAARTTMAIPYAGADEILTYARHYGAPLSRRRLVHRCAVATLAAAAVDHRWPNPAAATPGWGWGQAAAVVA